AETAHSIAKTMILPASLRYLAVIKGSGVAEGVGTEVTENLEAMGRAMLKLEQANEYPDDLEGLELAIHARDHQLAAMGEVREAADKLEKIVADDLWPLPKYEEMLFIM
ncbi:MAG: glutamine synthetase, partial [Solirubrobacterales bacterium]|nr:glutamine synthetase [Solirubrobacterales bacterium]